MESPLLSYLFQVSKKGFGPLQAFCARSNTVSTWQAVRWACSQRLSRVECGLELARPLGSLGPSRASRKVT